MKMGKRIYIFLSTVIAFCSFSCLFYKGYKNQTDFVVLLLDFCVHPSLSITNTTFQHKGVHQDKDKETENTRARIRASTAGTQTPSGRLEGQFASSQIFLSR